MIYYHLSRGRFEWGASPHELEDFGVDSEKAPARYVETYKVVKQALTQTQMNFQGGFYHFKDAPFEIELNQTGEDFSVLAARRATEGGFSGHLSAPI